MKHQYDVIIVGGRVAGCAAAIELAKQGRSVLVVDRMKFPADTLSTHFMNPRGMTYLRDLGVLDEVLEHVPAYEYLDVAVDDFSLGGSLDKLSLRERLHKVHGNRSFELETRYACIRRSFLDHLLQKKAVDLGVEILTGFNVVELIYKDGEVIGITGTTEGRRLDFHAKVVVGADGRQSKIAQLLGVKKHEEKTACTFACYTYFSGLNLTHGKLKRRHRIAYAAVPTNDGKTMVLVYGPKPFFPAFRQNKEANFFNSLKIIDSEFHSLLLETGTQTEPFYATDDQAAFMRQPSPLNVPLIGNAALFKDQCTASGMMYALRDGILLGEYLQNFFLGQTSLKEQLRQFEETRYLDSQRYYDFTCSQAEMNPIRDDEHLLYEAISQNQDDRNRFVGVYYDVVDTREFFSERNRQRLLRSVEHLPLRSRTKDFNSIYQNPFVTSKIDFDMAFEQTCLDFAQTPGKRFEDRVRPYFDFYQRRQKKCAYQYSRTLHSFPGPKTELSDEEGRKVSGINFASQDYLGRGHWTWRYWPDGTSGRLGKD